MFFLANVHEKREKRRRAEAAAERFEHRRAVEAEAAEIEPLDQRIAEIRYRLQQAQKPHAVKNPVARDECAAEQRADDAENDAEGRREQTDLKHQIFLRRPDRSCRNRPKTV